MAGGQALGKAFLDGVLSKITDPGQRAAAEAVFANAVIQTEIGSGVAGQQEIDRQLQDLRTKQQTLDDQLAEVEAEKVKVDTYKGELDGWFEGAKSDLALGKAARAKGFDPTKPLPTADHTKLPENVITADKLDEAITGMKESVLGFALEQNELMREHFQKFGSLLDINPLLRHPEIAKVGLVGVYQIVHKDALDAKAKELQEAEAEKYRKEGEARARSSQMPHMVPTGAGSGSPLDAIKPSGPDSVVDAATAEYHRLVASR